MPDSFAQYSPAVFGLVGTIIGASISAYYAYLNSNVTRRTKQRDLYRLLISELRTLSTHCELSANEIANAGSMLTVPQLRMAKYSNSGMMSFEMKEIYILNENLCQDIMQIILCARNNDIFLDHVIDIAKASEDFSEDRVQEAVATLTGRLSWLANLSDLVKVNLEKHVHKPSKYNEPRIQWGGRSNRKTYSVQKS